MVSDGAEVGRAGRQEGEGEGDEEDKLPYGLRERCGREQGARWEDSRLAPRLAVHSSNADDPKHDNISTLSPRAF